MPTPLPHIVDFTFDDVADLSNVSVALDRRGIPTAALNHAVDDDEQRRPNRKPFRQRRDGGHTGHPPHDSVRRRPRPREKRDEHVLGQIGRERDERNQQPAARIRLKPMDQGKEQSRVGDRIRDIERHFRDRVQPAVIS